MHIQFEFGETDKSLNLAALQLYWPQAQYGGPHRLPHTDTLVSWTLGPHEGLHIIPYNMLLTSPQSPPWENMILTYDYIEILYINTMPNQKRVQKRFSNLVVDLSHRMLAGAFKTIHEELKQKQPA